MTNINYMRTLTSNHKDTEFQPLLISYTKPCQAPRTMGAVAGSSYEDIYQTLLDHSNPQYPISEAIITRENHSFSSTLRAYIRNLRFDTAYVNKPLLILAATHQSHVQAAVLAAKKHGLQMKIRSGGHDYEGRSYVSDTPFFILDMFNLRSIDVDIENKTAWVQTGATLGELYYRIAEKSRCHAFPGGVCPTVGVGGHVVGGGYGNLMRKFGLTTDNVIDAKLVDADGRILDRKSMGEDLFWAIRGGGASFGVVLAYKINIVRVPETVTCFRVERILENNATDIVYQWQHVAPQIDNDLFIRLILDVVRDEQNSKTIRATFVALFLGESDRLLSITDASFPELGLLKSDCKEMSWVESILPWADYPPGTPIDVLLERTPWSFVYLKRKSDYVEKPIEKNDLEALWKKMIELEVPKMGFNPYGGKMGEIPSTATPFPHRAGILWKIQYQINWKESGREAEERHLELARKLHSYMTPYVSKNPRAAFINYKDLDMGINHHGKDSYIEGKGYGISYFKENYGKLLRIKSAVDPSNVFRHEQSIPLIPTHQDILDKLVRM